MSLSLVSFPKFDRYPNLRYGFSLRESGSMNRWSQKLNRELYFKAQNIDPGKIVTLDSVHGANAVKVGNELAGKMAQRVDVIITDERNLFLAATGADCFLIYSYDPAKQAVGITHAGWRGALGNLTINTVKAMKENFNSEPRNILVGVSPGIRVCHFEISPEDKSKFKRYKDSVVEKDGKVFVDLPQIIKAQLKQAGILEKNIDEGAECTYCEPQKYFSYRRHQKGAVKPEEINVMLGYIGIQAN